MSGFRESLNVRFYIRFQGGLFAARRMWFAPRVGDVCVFAEQRYRVEVVEWCLDLDATDAGTLVNVELVHVETP